eukprot:940533-Prymnesium_polylepis.1
MQLLLDRVRQRLQLRLDIGEEINQRAVSLPKQRPPPARPVLLVGQRLQQLRRQGWQDQREHFLLQRGVAKMAKIGAQLALCVRLPSPA